MVIIALLCALMTQNMSNICDIEQIFEYMNNFETSYTDSLKKEMDGFYKKIKDIDLNNYSDDQKCDIIFFMGIYHSKKINKKVDILLNGEIKNNELLGMCYFYKYQIGERKYLEMYLSFLEKQRSAIGDTRLIPPLAFLRDRKIALDYLNRHIVNADGAQAELMYETMNIIKTISKDDKIFLKYPHLKNIKR